MDSPLESSSEVAQASTSLDVDSENNILVSSDDEEDDDLDVDLATLAARPSRNISQPSAVTTTVSLSDDEEEINPQQNQTRSSKYSLRGRSVVNYSDLVLEEEDDDKIKSKSKESPSRKKNNILHLNSLKSSQIKTYLKEPSRLEKTPTWIFNLSSEQQLQGEADDLLRKFLKKCSTYCDKIFISCPSSFSEESTNRTIQNETDVRRLEILSMFFQHAELLTSIEIRYDWPNPNRNYISSVINTTKKLKAKSPISLKLTSRRGDGVLRDEDISSILKSGLQFRSLILGDYLSQSIKVENIEELLEDNKECLETLIIHGGFTGTTEDTKIMLKFPRQMKGLKILSICPIYSFVSVRVNPASKKSRIVNVDTSSSSSIEDGDPQRFSIKIDGDFSSLERLVLGNLVDLEEFGFSLLRKLTCFRAGSYWNLALKFPPSGSRQALKHSIITELQLPDALKDPLFILKVAEFFPSLKRVWIALPSVPVLRAFFKAFENSKLEALYLKTQFDFDSTMESCLLPEPDFRHEILSEHSKTVLQTLREYKHFDDYVRYHNIELPLEDPNEQLVSTHSAGIRSLKSLKSLELEHIPREVLIPNPEDERKWYDHNFKYLSTTFGFQNYPFSRKCHQEILKLNLESYKWKNLQISSSATTSFGQAGYVSLEEERLDFDNGVELGNFESDDEDLFTPIKRARGVNVKIKSSMLIPAFSMNIKSQQ